ncbi:hypothetical protein SAMN04488688_104310 [Paenibacillus sp. cl141a]|uniref:hypothetical protein n=1 Tax=Paenibacillus sp. cl141a TaxID=1761877 RepID=UPI0008B9678A|nr:hypothetical protein [Paenibacillus sp. cl141a]SEL52552.1 hypothetical protein SAMN04488688_104310 [Paenibacillus sp. cl141a]
MPIQLLDMRLSVHMPMRASDRKPIDISEPLLIGDIGLQTIPALGTVNVTDVRVWLSGTVSLLRPATTEAAPSSMTLLIERDGSGTPGSGTNIYEQVVNPGNLSFHMFPISLAAGDFPPTAVVNQGLIRYTLYIVSPGENSLQLSGPVSFSGIAVAGSG